MDTVTIYISGQVEPNPGNGAWAAALYFQNAQRLISGDLEMMTNHEAELVAAIEALKVLKRPCKVELYSCNQVFIYTADGRYQVNIHDALWQELRATANAHEITWRWVRKGESKRLDEVRHYAINRMMHPEVSE